MTTLSLRQSRDPLPPRSIYAPAASSGVGFTELASQLRADPQLLQSLQVPGTALLGLATDGVPLLIRLASPDTTHTLVTGGARCGKTELARTILASLVLFQKPRDAQIVILASQPEPFRFLVGQPHLLGNIATPAEFLPRLRWLEDEMERRTRLHTALPRLVVVMDDPGESLRPVEQEFRVRLKRLAESGRHVGISLVVCLRELSAVKIPMDLQSRFAVRIGAPDKSKAAPRGEFLLRAGDERVRFQTAALAGDDLSAFYALLRAHRAARPAKPASLWARLFSARTN